jgi:FlaA1/EpsC-like NDP-sugar epimerase
VLITGGSGFLGRALVEKLLADECPRICIYSRNEYSQAKMRAEFKDDPKLRWFIGDVRDVDRLERAMQSVHTVIHAAALKRIEVGRYNPDEMVKTNIVGFDERDQRPLVGPASARRCSCPRTRRSARYRLTGSPRRWPRACS